LWAASAPKSLFAAPQVALVPPMAALPFPAAVPRPQPAAPGAAFDGKLTFSFTLRLADDHGLGLDVVTPEGSRGLVVRQVLQDGAIEAWNRQCLDGSMACLKALQFGDAIVAVNGREDHEGMLQECRDKLLLKMTIERSFPGSAPATGYYMWPGFETLGDAAPVYGTGWGERLYAHRCVAAA